MIKKKLKEITDIPGYQGLYTITKDGKIWSYYSNKFLHPSLDKHNYLVVSLYKNKEQKKHFVHRLIALTYIPNPENKETVDHIDRNTLNNNISNLRWATQSEQVSNRTWTKNLQNNALKGAKIVSKPVEMRDMCNHSILLKEFPSCRAAAIEMFEDASKNSLINRCANGKKLSAYGYWWKFKE